MAEVEPGLAPAIALQVKGSPSVLHSVQMHRDAMREKAPAVGAPGPRCMGAAGEAPAEALGNVVMIARAG